MAAHLAHAGSAGNAHRCAYLRRARPPDSAAGAVASSAVPAASRNASCTVLRGDRFKEDTMRRHTNGGFTRTVAAAATGLAVGVVGSRLLPPMVAGVTGSMRASLGADPFERLMRDHRQIETILD